MPNFLMPDFSLRVHCIHSGFGTHLEMSALHVTATLIWLKFAWGFPCHPTFHDTDKLLCNESLWIFEWDPMTCNSRKAWSHDLMTLNPLEWLSNYSAYLISAMKLTMVIATEVQKDHKCMIFKGLVRISCLYNS